MIKEFLIKNGFHKSDSLQLWNDRKSGRSDYYTLRISDTIWLAYDLQNGFAELRLIKDGDRKRDKIISIMFPKPYKKERDIKKLLEVVC